MSYTCCSCGDSPARFWTHTEHGSDPHCAECYVHHAPHGQKGIRRAEVREERMERAECERHGRAWLAEMKNAEEHSS